MRHLLTVTFAGRLHDGSLLAAARHAYVQGMDGMLGTCAAVALAMAALAWIFMPRRAAPRTTVPADAGQSAHEHATSP